MEAAWPVATDRDGYEPRESPALAIEERFKMDISIGALVNSLRYEHVDLLPSTPERQILSEMPENSEGELVSSPTGRLRNRTSRLEPSVLEHLLMLLLSLKLQAPENRTPGFSVLPRGGWAPTWPRVG